jgi:hypothetical protein
VEKVQVVVPLWGRPNNRHVPELIQGLFMTVDGDSDVLLLGSHGSAGIVCDKQWRFRSGSIGNRTADEISVVVGNAAYQMLGTYFRIKDDWQMVLPE